MLNFYKLIKVLFSDGSVGCINICQICTIKPIKSCPESEITMSDGVVHKISKPTFEEWETDTFLDN